MPVVVDVMCLPMCIVDAIECTLVPFWIELRQFHVEQKYSLETSHEFCLGRGTSSVLIVSGENVFSISVAFVYS